METDKLTQKQKDAAACIVRGLTNKEVGNAVGCNRQTISVWKKKPEFQQYVQHLIEQTEMDKRTAVTLVSVQEEFDRRLSVNEWKAKRIELNKEKLEYGRQIVKKIKARFDDLPAEAFSPKELAMLFRVGEDMIDSGMEGWGEAIAIDETKSNYTGEIEAIQKLVDAGILPQSTLDSLTSAFDEFQKKAIAAFFVALHPNKMDM